MNKKIVIISNYYPPEMGAAANRIKNLAEGLEINGNNVTVICPLPNYPKGKVFKEYKNKFLVTEKINNIKIKRYWILPSTSKNPIIRLFSMLSFSWSLWFSFFSFLKTRPDIFIIQSPPLLVALSGLILSKFLGIKNVLNVSDIWPLSAYELGVIHKGFFYNFLEKIEKTNYKLANKIVGQSDEIISHIAKIIDKEFLVYRNVPIYKKYDLKEKSKGNLKIVYAGLLGYAQGILKICEALNFKELGVEFHIYGAGMDEEDIKKIIKREDKNIYFHGSKSSLEIKKIIRNYDVALVPLKNKIHGAVPSKIFELMQLGVPILYTTKGEASEIIKHHNIGLVTENNSIDAIKKTILKFNNLEPNDYKKMSNNCLDLHKNKHRLDYQLKNFISFISYEK